MTRRRSCTPCIRAKTRCSLVSSTSSEVCNRCIDRGIRCDYIKQVEASGEAGRDGAVATNDLASSSVQDDEIQGCTLSSVILGSNDRIGEQQIDTYVQSVPNAIPPALLEDPAWDFSLAETGIPEMESNIVENHENAINSGTISEESSKALVQHPPLSIWSSVLSSSSPFRPRVFTTPGQAQLAPLAMRILRSYPIMLQKNILPPFISPLLHSWTKADSSMSHQVSMSLFYFH